MCAFISYIASSYDFEQSLQTVKFSSTQSTATVYIKIKDDNRVEGTEAFQVEILIPYNLYSQGVHRSHPSRAKVFIKDGMQVHTHIPMKLYIIYCVSFR